VKFVRKVLVFGALVLIPGPAYAQDVRVYVTQLVDYFSTFSWLPILVSKGQKLGDVQAIGDQSLLQRASDCFPNLRTPNVDRPTLPLTMALDTTNAGLALGLDRLLGAKLAASGVEKVTVRFTDVTVETVYLADLVAALSPACESLRPYLTTGRRLVLFGKAGQVISTVVRAKREFAFQSTAGVDLSVVMNDLKSLLGPALANAVPIDAKLEAEMKLASRRGIFASSAAPEIVAFQPTHILSSGTLGGPATERADVPFDPKNPVHLEMLKSVGQLIQP
jgi:hypothetical protein